MKKLLLFGLLLLGISFVLAYVAPTQSNVVLIMESGYTAPSQSNVILVMNPSSSGNVTGDSCDTTTWDCTENCIVEGLDAGGKTIVASGKGTITVTGDVTNCASGVMYFIKNGCEVIVNNKAKLCN
jgi:hypothetical protein